ncbi:MAG TPA: EamA family transporter [Chthoniobacterales bacterium]|nr:EamA family transporter [Chthoniobacterales bacterium]
MQPPRKMALLAAFGTLYVVWGSTYLAIRFAIATIPPLLMVGTRYLLAGLIMYGIARWQRAPRGSVADWRNALIIGACLLLGGNGGVAIAEQYVSSGLASVMIATVPIYIALLGWAMRITERPRPIVWVGLAGGLIGVGILLAPALKFSGIEQKHAGLGLLILLFASFTWSAGSLYSRLNKNAPSPFLAAGQQMLCGGALLFLAGLIAGELRQFHPHEITALSFGAFLYLVIIGAIVGFTAYMWLLRHCDPAKVATYAYVNPIVAVLLGAVFAGETLGLRAVVAAGLIIGSVALVITVQQTRRSPAPAVAAVSRAD